MGISIQNWDLYGNLYLKKKMYFYGNIYLFLLEYLYRIWICMGTSIFKKIGFLEILWEHVLKTMENSMGTAI